MRQWDVGTDVDLNMLRCPLCESQKDTHEHLFFECSFSALVWNSVRHLAGMDHIQPKLNDVVLFLKPMANKRTANNIIGRLILAATSYFIWVTLYPKKDSDLPPLINAIEVFRIGDVLTIGSDSNDGSTSVAGKKKSKLPVILGTTIPSFLLIWIAAGIFTIVRRKMKHAKANGSATG
ncbi:hypothetical protein Tco_0051788 [Tanacetum coccineum]